jgi:threonine/homoserine/homoserine lactone efflux protein
VSPGPLQSYVLAATLQRGFGAGFRVALAPLVSDAPIVAAALLTLGVLPPVFLVGASLIGGVFVVGLGLQTVHRARSVTIDGPAVGSARRDLAYGVLVNVLNPHPWVFWFGVGAPMLIAAVRDAPLDGALFLAGFYGLLVGSKVLLAGLVAGGRRRLTDSAYRAVVAASGILLVLLGFLLVSQAIQAGLAG